ncbi:cob(I)yrinic acid a,c-diamide adenosyltransferase [Paratissierella segnis]|jgi:cob(I)alamin adenosyltransferase|uniref:Cob(I)yrinic acid a,c-diamide adenosyltransferase n=1 Tax=Paratissierella segnis TaxID=2763679 RepID=A0A926IK34_9FIRM|nr:cob(I)yrinic acid a,c-diamide adenosyltransferase [Paratissierella segnis]MBC8588644.1 cob(I)yrinic acid a,c-diamide adenosyltransferase [Paratissierella segnis]
MDKGYVQIYTGNGKGKTTAALGLSLRAVSIGKKVFFGQFVKGMKYSEVNCTDFVPNIEFEQFGKECFIYNDPTEDDIKRAEQGLAKMSSVLKDGKYDVVVMDELNIALYFKLFTVEEVIKAISNRAPHVEVIITGRYAPKELVEIADLITEMKEIKHYYTKGVENRKGIDF